MLDLMKVMARLGARRRQPDPDSECRASALGGGLASEYQTLIETEFARWGLAGPCVQVRARKVGVRADGFEVFAGVLTLAEWDRDTALCVMLGLPMLDSKIRRLVQATWLPDCSHFDGLWLHPSSRLKVPSELRDLLVTLVPRLQRRQNSSAGGATAAPSDLMPLSTRQNTTD